MKRILLTLVAALVLGGLVVRSAEAQGPYGGYRVPVGGPTVVVVGGGGCYGNQGGYGYGNGYGGGYAPYVAPYYGVPQTAPYGAGYRGGYQPYQQMYLQRLYYGLGY